MFHGQDLLHLSNEEIRSVRGAQIGMIFQDPMTSLNPVLTIGKQVSEPLILHLGMTKKDAEERVVELLRLVGIPEAEKPPGAVPPPVLRRHAPARHDRHGPGLQPPDPDR